MVTKLTVDEAAEFADSDAFDALTGQLVDEEELNASSSWEIKLEDTIDKLNEQYAVVLNGSKVLILKSIFDDTFKRSSRVYLSEKDFVLLLKNKLIQVGVKGKNTPVFKSLGVVWIESPRRRSFTDGIVFYPSQYPNGTEKPVKLNGNKLNLWEGFCVKPIQGSSWGLLQNHIENVICNGNSECYEYLMNWIARCFQYPDQNGQVAVVLIGKKGTGKGTLGNFINSLFGQHGIQINNSKHLTGSFNGHMKDCCFLFADEVFNVGDKQAENILKGLITEPTVMIERKGVDPESVINRLKIIMTSNEQKVVPVSSDERRYFVMEVSDSKIGDTDYFNALRDEIEKQSTKEAFLYDLLHRDISQFNVSKVPETKALQQQRAESLDSFSEFWSVVLKRGYISQTNWIEVIKTEEIIDEYHKWCNSQKLDQYKIKSHGTIGKHLSKWGYSKKRLSDQGRSTGYNLGSLESAIAQFIKVEKLDPSSFE